MPPTLRQSLSKRALGLANLYVKGRVSHFSAEVAQKAIEKVVELAPDGVAITGDLTALASEAEFERAAQALAPLYRFPTAIIPGNHDYYTRGARDTARIERFFGMHMRGELGAPGQPVQYPTVFGVGPVRLFGLNPCRPTVGSSGLVSADEVGRLRALLEQPRGDGEVRVLMIHYPLLGIDGQPITRWSRRLNGREALLELLETHPVELVLHGHDHVRCHNRLGGEAPTYVINSGSAAFAPRPGLPVPASFNVYTLGEGRLQGVAHYDLVDGAFELTYDGPPPEIGPSYNRAGYAAPSPDAYSM